MIGRIARLVPERGFGFIKITPDDPQDIFMHVSQVMNRPWDDLVVGERVEFTLAPSARKPGQNCAANVVVL